MAGDPRIGGKHDQIYAVPGIVDGPKRPGFMIYANCEPSMGWPRRGLGSAINDKREGGFRAARLR